MAEREGRKRQRSVGVRNALNDKCGTWQPSRQVPGCGVEEGRRDPRSGPDFIKAKRGRKS